MKFDFLSESDQAYFIHKASTLVEALPYIRQHSGEIIVIKYGAAVIERPSKSPTDAAPNGVVSRCTTSLFRVPLYAAYVCGEQFRVLLCQSRYASTRRWLSLVAVRIELYSSRCTTPRCSRWLGQNPAYRPVHRPNPGN